MNSIIMNLGPSVAGITPAQEVGPIQRLVFGEHGASALARETDDTMLWIFGFNVIWFVFLMALMFWWSWRYRRRPGVPPQRSAHHNTPLELAWTIVPSLFLGYMFYRGFAGYIGGIVAPSNAEIIDIRGIKWKWTATYDNGANAPDSMDAGGMRALPVIYVPVGRPILFRMTSSDVLHSFWIPDFRYKFDVIPNRYTNYWINAEEPGEHWIFCAEYCGDYHSEMAARLVAIPAAEYDQLKSSWAVTGTPAERGKAMVERKGGCIACHSLDGTKVIGPTWLNAWGYEVPLSDGSTIPADDPAAWDNYIRESLVNPAAKVHAGYPPVMSSFAGVFTDEEIGWIVAYIRSLSDKGQQAGGEGAGGDAGAGSGDGQPQQ